PILSEQQLTYASRAKATCPDQAESKSQLEDYRLDQLHGERLTRSNTAISLYDQNTNCPFGCRTQARVTLSEASPPEIHEIEK
ncbi:MAG: hypothetical protein ACM3ND_03905, partial [Acidobacteriota bacterium]